MRCGCRTEETRGNSRGKAANSASSSSTPRGRLCRCGARTILYMVKQGVNKGKLFWRCPNWMMPTTCDLFVWAEDMEEVVADDGGNQAVAEVVSLALEVLEEGKKKSGKMQKKLNAERFAGKLKLICLMLSVLLNLYFFMTCGEKPKLCIGGCKLGFRVVC